MRADIGLVSTETIDSKITFLIFSHCVISRYVLENELLLVIIEVTICR